MKNVLVFILILALFGCGASQSNSQSNMEAFLTEIGECLIEEDVNCLCDHMDQEKYENMKKEKGYSDEEFEEVMEQFHDKCKFQRSKDIDQLKELLNVTTLKDYKGELSYKYVSDVRSADVECGFVIFKLKSQGANESVLFRMFLSQENGKIAIKKIWVKAGTIDSNDEKEGGYNENKTDMSNQASNEEVNALLKQIGDCVLAEDAVSICDFMNLEAKVNKAIENGKSNKDAEELLELVTQDYKHECESYFEQLKKHLKVEDLAVYKNKLEYRYISDPKSLDFEKGYIIFNTTEEKMIKGELTQLKKEVFFRVAVVHEKGKVFIDKVTVSYDIVD